MKIKRTNKLNRKKKRIRKIIKVSIRLFLIFFFAFSLLNMLKFIFNKAFALNTIAKRTTTVDHIDNKNINTNVQASITNSNFTVCIDPGHGDRDNGTKSSLNTFEKDIALNVSLKIGDILKKNGVNVIYTRTSNDTSLPSDIKLNLRERVRISNESNADVFVSIHCNGSVKSNYKGIETWCRFPNTEGETLAKQIQNALIDTNYSTDRGVKYETERSLAVLKLNNSVSVLVELGFLTNLSDAEFISSENGQKTCSEAIAKAILDYKLVSKES